jgi:hypothetical protein
MSGHTGTEPPKEPIMFRKILATAGIAAGLAVLAPSTANADTYNQYRMLQPGQSVCVQDNVTAYDSAHGVGSVYSGHAVRFTFGPWFPFQQALYDTGVNTTSIDVEAHRYQSPLSFPAVFQICAYNQSQKVSYVQLRAYAIR